MNKLKEMDMFGAVTSKEGKQKVTPAIGIDLGTTNSCVAVIREGNIPEIVGDRKTMPSCVMWNGKTGDEKAFIVGEEAYLNRYKPSVAYSVKKLMGSDRTVTLSYGGKDLVMKPEEVGAEVLKELVKRTKLDYPDIEDAVITVPAGFSSEQVKATIKAGELAGLNVLKVSREPTAASLVYNIDKIAKGEEYVLVFDLGGGTFDISLVRITKNTTEDTNDFLADIYGIGEAKETDEVASDEANKSIVSVIKTDGSVSLGGDDLDLELYKILEEKMISRGIDTNHIPKEEREKLILKLSSYKPLLFDSYVEVILNFKLNNKLGTKVNEKIFLTPADYERATKVIYTKCKYYVDQVMQGSEFIKIDHIVLVGGSTKNKYLKQMLKKDFPKVSFNDSLNPDETVALGAAVEAKRAKFKDDYLEIFDVTPLAIGVLSSGLIDRMIKKNQVVPYNYTKMFTTSKDNQDKVIVPVYEGNSPIPEECCRLGEIIIDNLPKKPKGELPIYVNLSVNANGLLTCYVTIEGNRTEKEIVNIFAANEVAEKRIEITKTEDKKVVRWTRFAGQLEDAVAKERLLAMIEGYKEGGVSVNEIADYIRELRGDLTEIRSSRGFGINQTVLSVSSGVDVYANDERE